jgi:hypothetical protein
MMAWLRGTAAEHKLILQPDSSATVLPGFKSGTPLSLTGAAGDTVGSILDRFNTYRAPDSQIRRVWNTDGTPLPPSTPVDGSLRAVIRAASCG